MASRGPPEGLQIISMSPDAPTSSSRVQSDFSRMTIVSVPEPPHTAPPVNEPSSVAFVKGGKRKRLSKACDACHKSKRRCDGTAPCSNCYFASKECTYTDASGRPVPAPRNNNPERFVTNVGDPPPQHNAAPTGYFPGTQEYTDNRTAADPSTSRAVRRPAASNDSSTKRVRPEGPILISPPLGSPTSSGSANSPSLLLDPSTTHDLVNLFFAHCNPQRLVLHKPSFFAALANDQIPSYLTLAICALSAPMSKEFGLKSTPPRLAGVPFFREAISIMFDASGRLLSEPTLATAQALCLLEMHEVAASHSWTRHYRYFDLAVKLLEDSLEVDQPDPPLTFPLSPNARNIFIERECTRRCFWLVQLMGWINGIYTYRPMRPRSIELMRQVRLPIDETSFELVVPSQTSEFMHVPAPRTKNDSQFGHLCRILSLYQTLESVLAEKEGSARAAAVAESKQAFNVWVASLPDHLRFSEDNLEKQLAMFETSSNTGPWCFCFIHVLQPCYVLSLLEGEGKQGEPVVWVRNQLNMIFDAIGKRAKNTLLSACALWSYSKYHPDDPQLQLWDDEFEKIWGFRVAVIADQWRKCQAEQRTQIGRTYPVDSISQRETAPAFAVADTSSSSSVPAAPANVSPKGHLGSLDPRLTGGSTAGASEADVTARGRAYAPEASTSNEDPAAYATGRKDPLSLPSLKASGLLDSWTPRTSRPEEHRTVTASTTVAAGPSSSVYPTSVQRGAIPNAGMPVGLNWLSSEP